MEINFKGPVMPIDPYSQLAFVEILNSKYPFYYIFFRGIRKYMG